MVRIKCILNYNDLRTNTLRKVGNEYVETKERAQEIINKGYAVFVEEIIEDATIKEEKEIAKKKTNAKK